jgi:hypothetical protein
MGTMHTAVRSAALILVAAIAGGCIPPAAETVPPTGPTPPAASPTAVPSPAGPSGPPSFIRPTPTPLPTFVVYTVRPGDTLTSIARMFRTTPRSIAFWNRANHPSLDPDSPDYEPDRIEAGWDLFLVPDVELDPEDLPDESPAGPASPSAS